MEPIYPIVWLKELLGLYLWDQEGAHHWLSMLTELHSRGVKDMLIACVKGFPEAIESIYSNTEIQHCVIHQIHNSKVRGRPASEGFHGRPEMCLSRRHAHRR